jgi:hypothetical protein
MGCPGRWCDRHPERTEIWRERAAMPLIAERELDHEASIWALLAQPDGHSQPQDLSDLLTVLAASPELRSAALLRMF